jgi:cation:H+ antiporter
VAVLWWRERQRPAIGELAEDDRGTQARSTALALTLALAGIGVMIAGGWLAVGGAQRVVATLGLSDSAVGLTLLALATTAELLALAWSAIRRDIPEIAIAGVVGSVAYNATATLGAAALTRPLAVPGMLTPAIIAAALPLVLLALAPRCRLKRPAGAVLAAGYLAFVIIELSH